MGNRYESRAERKSFLDKFRLPGKTALVTGGSRGCCLILGIGGFELYDRTDHRTRWWTLLLLGDSTINH